VGSRIGAHLRWCGGRGVEFRGSRAMVVSVPMHSVVSRVGVCLVTVIVEEVASVVVVQ